MWLWRRGRQGEAQSEGGWSFPMWVGLDRALRGRGSMYPHPTPTSISLVPAAHHG